MWKEQIRQSSELVLFVEKTCVLSSFIMLIKQISKNLTRSPDFLLFYGTLPVLCVYVGWIASRRTGVSSCLVA